MQAVCNANLEFISLVARWQGSVHDSTIFNNSRLRALFEAGRYGNSLLLGDSDYPLKEYLMTPLQGPQTPAEQLYNESLIRTRISVERMFGIWKRRFPILSLGSRFKEVNSILAVIIATAVLHNIARRAGDPLPENDELQVPWEDIENDEGPHNGRMANNHVQNTLISDYFQR